MGRPLEGRAALVTGGGTPLGKAIALHLGHHAAPTVRAAWRGGLLWAGERAAPRSPGRGARAGRGRPRRLHPSRARRGVAPLRQSAGELHVNGDPEQANKPYKSPVPSLGNI